MSAKARRIEEEVIFELWKAALTRCEGVDYEGLVRCNKGQWLHRYGIDQSNKYHLFNINPFKNCNLVRTGHHLQHEVFEMVYVWGCMYVLLNFLIEILPGFWSCFLWPSDGRGDYEKVVFNWLLPSWRSVSMFCSRNF